MLRNKKMAKYLIIALFLGMIVCLLIPNISKAATEYTYNDTEQGIEWSYELDSNNNVINLKCKTTNVVGTVTIPSTIDGKNVISLGYKAFYNFTGLRTVVMPNSVTAMDDYAFSGCSGLASITLSENLTTIGNRAFYDCTGLKTIVIPNNVTKINVGTFADCSGLNSITLSKNLTTIDTSAFAYCTGLKSVIIPESVTTIASGGTLSGAFCKCSNLEKILIPDNVSSIGKDAFYDCKKLTIYGNDGQASREFAEQYKIKFDYISNWDKESSGTDVTAPTVTNINVKHASVMDYWDKNQNMYVVPANAKLVIDVNFSEPIEGTEVPTLKIKFGVGENIQLTEGTVGGSKITYVYTVKNTDKGTMSAVDFSGGNIKDAAGNVATLSCPSLRVELDITASTIYANGTITNPDNEEDKENKPDTKPDTTPDTKPDTKPNDQDDTKAPGKIPQTGEKIMLVIAIIVIIGIGAFAYMKYNKYKEI